MNESDKIEILGVRALKNPVNMREKLQFQILFELKEVLHEKLHVKFIYVPSPINKKKDEELETYQIFGQQIGKFKITFFVTPPPIKGIKVSDLFGITVLLIQFIYKEFEFTRVGYYINNELKGPIEKDSSSEFFFKVKNTERNILIKEPRVTQFFFQTK